MVDIGVADDTVTTVGSDVEIAGRRELDADGDLVCPRLVALEALVLPYRQASRP